jgi:hypothetical protein
LFPKISPDGKSQNNSRDFPEFFLSRFLGTFLIWKYINTTANIFVSVAYSTQDELGLFSRLISSTLTIFASAVKASLQLTFAPNTLHQEDVNT